MEWLFISIMVGTLLLQFLGMLACFRWFRLLRFAFSRPFLWIGWTHALILLRRLHAFALWLESRPTGVESMMNDLLVPLAASLFLIASAVALRKAIIQSLCRDDAALRELEELTKRLVP
jgi:hypothetical protein